MRLGLDYHIHTFYQRCGNETLSLGNIVRKAEALQMTSLAITDHLNTVEQLPAFWYIKRDLEYMRNKTKIELFFGCELNFQSCDGEFAYSEAIRDEYGFQIAIGGIHSAYTDSQDVTTVRDLQQRHFMRTLQDPLLDVLVHPYWFCESEWHARPPEFWEEVVGDMPDSYITELASASAETGTGIEVNACAIFYNPTYRAEFKRVYVEFLARLRDAGALFSVASDAHDLSHLGTTEYVEGLLDGLAIPPERLWRPRPT
jgi:histidinol phosphatase-like PHP family hydrolase